MKKILIVLISICVFFFTIYLIVPYLIDFGLQKNTNNQNHHNELKKILEKNSEFDKMFEKIQAKEFLNRDNLYENYSHNYTIKIPENYKQNDGIGKYSSTQFYNQDLGFVVAINVGNSDLGKNITKIQKREIIKRFPNELKKDNSLGKMFEQTLTERGFNNPKLISYETTNYNNRLFLRLNFQANRISDNEEYPVLITNFMTFYKDLFYHFQFVTYQKESSKIWNSEIQKSMNNVIISEYIVEKN